MNDNNPSPPLVHFAPFVLPNALYTDLFEWLTLPLKLIFGFGTAHPKIIFKKFADGFPTGKSSISFSNDMTKGTSLGFGVKIWHQPIHSNVTELSSLLLLLLLLSFLLLLFLLPYFQKIPWFQFFILNELTCSINRQKCEQCVFAEHKIWKARRTTRKWLRSYFTQNRGNSLVLALFCSASPTSQKEAGRDSLCYSEHICGHSTKSGDVFQWLQQKRSRK